LGNKFLTRMCL